METKSPKFTCTNYVKDWLNNTVHDITNVTPAEFELFIQKLIPVFPTGTNLDFIRSEVLSCLMEYNVSTNPRIGFKDYRKIQFSPDQQIYNILKNAKEYVDSQPEQATKFKEEDWSKFINAISTGKNPSKAWAPANPLTSKTWKEGKEDTTFAKQALTIAVSTDNQVLKGYMNKYIYEPPDQSKLRSTKTRAEAISDFLYFVNNHNSTKPEKWRFSVHPNKYIKKGEQPEWNWEAIVRIKSGSELRFISESLEGNEDPLAAAARGFAEETGSVIPNEFFTRVDMPSKSITTNQKQYVYCLKIDKTAKQTILDNYNLLVPLTEVFDLQWVPNSENIQCNSQKVVMKENIKQFPDIQIVSANRKGGRKTKKSRRLSKKSIRTRSILWPQKRTIKSIKCRGKKPKLFTQRRLKK